MLTLPRLSLSLSLSPLSSPLTWEKAALKAAQGVTQAVPSDRWEAASSLTCGDEKMLGRGVRSRIKRGGGSVGPRGLAPFRWPTSTPTPPATLFRPKGAALASALPIGGGPGRNAGAEGGLGEASLLAHHPPLHLSAALPTHRLVHRPPHAQELAPLQGRQSGHGVPVARGRVLIVKQAGRDLFEELVGSFALLAGHRRPGAGRHCRAKQGRRPHRGRDGVATRAFIVRATCSFPGWGSA